MVTNEAIVSSSVAVPEPTPTYEPEPVAPPSFSALESSGRSGGGRFLKIAVVLAVVAGGGYFAWQRPQVRQYVQNVVQRVKPAQSTAASNPQGPTPVKPTADQSSAPPRIDATPSTQDASNSPQPPATASAQAEPSMNFNEDIPQESSMPATSAKSAPTDEIEVQELPLSRDSKLNPTPKVQPIVVKSGAAVSKSTSVTAPPIDVVPGTDTALPSVTPTNFELPRPAPGTIRISQGVSQGLLIKKVQPVYPPMAQQFHRQGSVQLLATINKSGDTSKVQILSGDPMLSRAAVDAVKQWKYRPYLLNGQPVEIETQITVVFNGQ